MTTPNHPFENDPVVISHDNDIPYAERSIHAVVWLGAALLLIGGFAGWFFLSAHAQDAPENIAQANEFPAGNEQVQAQSQEGDSMVENIIDEMFSTNIETDAGGPNSGIVSNSPSVDSAIEAHLDLQRQAQALTRTDDGYRNSFFDVLGADVQDKNGETMGQLYDILVNSKSGEAQTLIISNGDNTSALDLKSIDFANVFTQNAQGMTKLNFDESAISDSNAFDYTAERGDETISLRRLKSGQFLDVDGMVAGQIDAIIYGNGEAQGVVLNLRRGLESESVDNFFLNMSEANIVENPDGLDVQLSEEQTRAIAERVFDESNNLEAQQSTQNKISVPVPAE